jgi:prepilin-type N-terminal cleavage/methylation domain-containing protein
MRRKHGFTIIELLVALAIVGILVAIAVWNYHTSIQRARQKRTMADMRSIATAWEGRATDVKSYNAAAAGFTMPAAPITFGEMNTLLVPTYIKVLPRIDGWGHPFDFAADQAVGSGTGADLYALRSPGRDGVYATSYVLGGTTDFDCDIVYSGGSFVIYPEGLQR